MTRNLLLILVTQVAQVTLSHKHRLLSKWRSLLRTPLLALLLVSGTKHTRLVAQAATMLLMALLGSNLLPVIRLERRYVYVFRNAWEFLIAGVTRLEQVIAGRDFSELLLDDCSIDDDSTTGGAGGDGRARSVGSAEYGYGSRRRRLARVSSSGGLLSTGGLGSSLRGGGEFGDVYGRGVDFSGSVGAAVSLRGGSQTRSEDQRSVALSLHRRRSRRRRHGGSLGGSVGSVDSGDVASSDGGRTGGDGCSAGGIGGRSIGSGKQSRSLSPHIRTPPVATVSDVRSGAPEDGDEFAGREVLSPPDPVEVSRKECARSGERRRSGDTTGSSRAASAGAGSDGLAASTSTSRTHVSGAAHGSPSPVSVLAAQSSDGVADSVASAMSTAVPSVSTSVLKPPKSQGGGKLVSKNVGGVSEGVVIDGVPGARATKSPKARHGAQKQRLEQSSGAGAGGRETLMDDDNRVGSVSKPSGGVALSAPRLLVSRLNVAAAPWTRSEAAAATVPVAKVNPAGIRRGDAAAVRAAAAASPGRAEVTIPHALQCTEWPPAFSELHVSLGKEVGAQRGGGCRGLSRRYVSCLSHRSSRMMLCVLHGRNHGGLWYCVPWKRYKS